MLRLSGSPSPRGGGANPERPAPPAPTPIISPNHHLPIRHIPAACLSFAAIIEPRNNGMTEGVADFFLVIKRCIALVFTSRSPCPHQGEKGKRLPLALYKPRGSTSSWYGSGGCPKGAKQRTEKMSATPYDGYDNDQGVMRSGMPLRKFNHKY